MRNLIFSLLFLANLFLMIFKNYVEATEGAFIWHDWYRISTFKCLKDEHTKEFVFVNANYVDSGEPNLYAELNIINARAAGIKNVDIYIYPCFKPSEEYKICGNGSESITNVLDYFNNINVKYGRVWLYITLGIDDCKNPSEWDRNNKTKNMEFIEANFRFF
uniref:Uncharacterized protein n=1 Tax=Meloidogyne hapla TaxID=6305 RepID=A0A1I8B436_MELHA